MTLCGDMLKTRTTPTHDCAMADASSADNHEVAAPLADYEEQLLPAPASDHADEESSDDDVDEGDDMCSSSSDDELIDPESVVDRPVRATRSGRLSRAPSRFIPTMTDSGLIRRSEYYTGGEIDAVLGDYDSDTEDEPLSGEDEAGQEELAGFIAEDSDSDTEGGNEDWVPPVSTDPVEDDSGSDSDLPMEHNEEELLADLHDIVDASSEARSPVQNATQTVQIEHGDEIPLDLNRNVLEPENPSR